MAVTCPDSVGGSCRTRGILFAELTAKTTPVDDRSTVFQSLIIATLLATIVPMAPIDNVTAFLGRNEVVTPVFDDDELSHQFWTKFVDAK